MVVHRRWRVGRRVLQKWAKPEPLPLAGLSCAGGAHAMQFFGEFSR